MWCILSRRQVSDSCVAHSIDVSEIGKNDRAGSDSGLYDDDNPTKTATPTIDITADQAGDTIRVYRECALLGEATRRNLG